MTTKTKQWADGSIATIQYEGQGDGNIIITSDPNNLYEARSMQIAVETTDGSGIQRIITINQAAKQRIDLSAAIVTAANQTYNGGAKTPTPTVTLNGSTVPSTGYDVSYSNNTNAGTATITITGKGDYTGTASGTFTIAKATPSYTSPATRSLTYSGSSQYLTTSGSTSHGTIYYSTDGSNWYTSRRTGTNAGTYYCYWKLVGDSNHTDISSTYIGTTSIAKASRTLSFADSYMVLNTSSTGTKTATPSAGSGDGAITYSIANTTYATINSSTGAVTAKTSDGSVIVTATIATGTNYLSASASYTLYVFATTHNYSYSGSVKNVTLPPGTYQFQCWGAQGASCSDGYSGGKGGYSVGQLSIANALAIQVLVGGQNGYNGGGSSSGSASYSSGNTYGRSSMGNGGGASDIRLSDGNLLSRMIVAGGGSGGAYCYKEVSSQDSNTYTSSTDSVDIDSAGYYIGRTTFNRYFYADRTYTVSVNNGTISSVKLGNTEVGTSFTPSSSGNMTLTITVRYRVGDAVVRNVQNIGNFSTASVGSMFFTSNLTALIYKDSSVSSYEIFPNRSQYLPSDAPVISDNNYFLCSQDQKIYLWNGSSFYVAEHTSTLTEYYTTYTSSEDYQYGYAGGGTNGVGYSSTYQGKQNAAGSGGSFGQGANQIATNYRYCSGAGGGGWYGGGGGQYSDNSMSYVHYSGGGSGWVNIAANAGNRPSGYTGLELDSGTTYAGNTSFPSTGGGTETGHSGNGYARITRL